MTDTLSRVAQVLEERKGASPDSSYVASLYHKGLNKILEKVGEESVETIISVNRECRICTPCASCFAMPHTYAEGISIRCVTTFYGVRPYGEALVPDAKMHPKRLAPRRLRTEAADRPGGCYSLSVAADE